MLDWFSIFTKGGIVLWYFQGQALSHTPAVNSLIRSVILQVSGERRRSGVMEEVRLGVREGLPLGGSGDTGY